MKEKTCYPHPFSMAYWKDAAAECRNIRSLTYAALLCALAIVIEKFSIPIAPSVYISMSFLVISLCSMLTGPVLAVFCGIVVDLIGAINSPYSFFLGYTLTAVLTAVLYALFLYRAKISVTRVLLSKLAVNLLVNTLIGSLWRIMYYGGMSYGAYALLTGIKNLVLLPLEVFLICVLFRALQKPLLQLHALPAEVRVTYRKQDFVLLAVFAVGGAVLLLIFSQYYGAVKAAVQSLFS